MFYAKRLLEVLEQGRGARIGHTAVISRKIHSQTPQRPGQVNIIVNSDAGQTLYYRENKNEIIHIDIFHEIAKGDIHEIASYLIKNLEVSPLKDFTDYIDIFTAKGGGRLTGNLDCKSNEILEKSHLNHVHLTCKIPEDIMISIFHLIEKTEEALLNQNIELRKVDKIKHVFGKRPLDMSNYSTDFDSKLREKPEAINQMLYKESRELLEKHNSFEEVYNTLKGIRGDLKNSCDSSIVNGGIISDLIKKGFVETKSGKTRFTEKGEELFKYFCINKVELQSLLKKIIYSYANNTKGNPSVELENLRFNNSNSSNRGAAFQEKYDKNDWIDELDLPETLKNSLVRFYQVQNKDKLTIAEEDFVTIKNYSTSKKDICLIIDASASMAGERLKNAKVLAKFLVLKTKGKVSVLTFQEKNVKIRVPFTKEFSVMEQKLSALIATGLTPLALALDKSLEYISMTRGLKNPLIILVTDGIPTVSHWSQDPLKDAMEAAQKIAKQKVDFCCIGLKPNHEYLAKIVREAKGRLFIIDELNREGLIKAVYKQRVF